MFVCLKIYKFGIFRQSLTMLLRLNCSASPCIKKGVALCRSGFWKRYLVLVVVSVSIIPFHSVTALSFSSADLISLKLSFKKLLSFMLLWLFHNLFSILCIWVYVPLKKTWNIWFFHVYWLSYTGDWLWFTLIFLLMGFVVSTALLSVIRVRVIKTAVPSHAFFPLGSQN